MTSSTPAHTPTADLDAAPVAVVTGASSGIGAATARALAADGFSVVLGARRTERLHAEVASIVAAGGDARALPLDVTDQASVDAFCAEVPRCDLLVNNAGGALGLDPVLTDDLARWQTMYDTNVLGAVRMVRGLAPALQAAPAGLIVTIGSVAGFEHYSGGAGYIAAKHGAHGVMHVLRQELLPLGLRSSIVAPGLVETEFSLVRFDGDADRAAAVYEGITPLTADDIAECVRWIATQPAHVDIDLLVVRPQAQATVHHVHRSPTA